MAPNFSMPNGDAALAQVAPTTARLQSQVLSAFGLNLAVGLPQTSTTGSQAVTSATTNTQSIASGVTTNNSSVASGNSSALTNTTAPGVVPTVPTGVPTGATLPAAGGIAGDIGIDPLLKYYAAESLFQAVRNMNAEVQNVVSEDCFVPYLVQLKLAVMPYQRHLPYDIHARIGFFPADLRADPDAKDPKVQKDPCLEVNKNTGTFDEKADGPRVIPLLVTDDIERAMTSRAVEVARQIGLALSGMVHGVGGNVGASAASQDVQSISGQDIDSTFTVTRQSDNTLYVRIGASNEGTAGYALVGQTHDISVLVLVPRTYFGRSEDKPGSMQLNFVTHTQFRDAETGAILPDMDKDVLEAQEDDAMKGFLENGYDAMGLPEWNKIDVELRHGVVKGLLAAIQDNDIDHFADVMCDLGRAPLLPDAAKKQLKGHRLLPSFDCSKPDNMETVSELAESLWTRLSLLLTDSAYKSSYLMLYPPAALNISGPQPPGAKAGDSPPGEIPVTAFDDKETLQVSLQNSDGMSAFAASVRLDMTYQDGDKKKRIVSFLPTAMNQDPTSHLLSLTFPSPAKWGVPAAAEGELHFQRHCQDSTRALCPDSVALHDFKIAIATSADDAAKDTLASFKLTAAKSIVTHDGTAPFNVKIDKLGNGEVVTLAVNGDPQIDSATAEGNKPLAISGGAVAVTQNGVVSLHLSNLRGGDSFTITGAGKKGDAATGKATTNSILIVKQ